MGVEEEENGEFLCVERDTSSECYVDTSATDSTDLVHLPDDLLMGVEECAGWMRES